MKVTKLGHCCLVIEEGDLRILTDPGAYSTLQNEAQGLDLILITHEHQDHFHVESLKTVLKNNPNATIATNKGVGALLDKEGISYKIVADGEQVEFKKVLIEGLGRDHAIIYPSWKAVENTGYFIANKLFYPGDAFFDPKRLVDVLALPVAGPWMKISEAIDYALTLKPRVAFPVHDGMLQKDKIGVPHRVTEHFLTQNDIKFIALHEGESSDF